MFRKNKDQYDMLPSHRGARVFRPNSDRLVSAEKELNRLREQVQDLTTLFQTAQIAKGCGCCADNEREHEVYNVKQAMRLGWSDDEEGWDENKYQDHRKDVLTRFEILRKKYKCPSYSEEFYGEDDDV